MNEQVKWVVQLLNRDGYWEDVLDLPKESKERGLRFLAAYREAWPMFKFQLVERTMKEEVVG